LVIIALSVVLGFVLLKTGATKHVLTASQDYEYMGMFIVGMFFTSVFTTVPATIVIGELALVTNLLPLVLIGGLGALCGDFVIFRFFKDNISEDLRYLFEVKKKSRWKLIFKSRIFKVFLTLIGGIIIASPLPDELGLALMGISKTKSFTFIFISFLCNALGILFIALAARTIA